MVFLCRNTLFPCACCLLLIEIYKSCSKNLANTLAYFIVLLSFTYPLSVLLVPSTHHPRHPSPLLFHPCLKPFSAHPSNGSLPFLQDWLHGFPTVFTNTSEHIRQYPGSENYAMQYKKSSWNEPYSFTNYRVIRWHCIAAGWWLTALLLLLLSLFFLLQYSVPREILFLFYPR